jgi:hypothetical protein
MTVRNSNGKKAVEIRFPCIAPTSSDVHRSRTMIPVIFAKNLVLRLAACKPAVTFTTRRQ